MTNSEPSVLVAGEALIDFIPDHPGALSHVETFDRRAGGAPANVAVGLARLEETPWLCSTISTDPFGEFLAERLASEGLPERFITRVENSTTLAFVSHGENADREFSFHRQRTADTVLQTDVVDTATLSAVDWVVVGGVTLSSEPARSATFKLVERARAADCRIVFDPNTRPELWTDTDDMTLTFDQMLEQTDVLKMTREDFEATAFNTTNEDFAERLLQKGPEIVLLTEGQAGARAIAESDSPWGGGKWQHPGYEIDAVDTTGAGDAFLAGAITAFVENRSPSKLLAFANAVAALATTEGGAMTALPDRDAVNDLMEGR
ncbi:carbohydrate kinase [Halonotius terrestris]|uniref:Carbohydrate kinase n=1 Tax=Halonotius terrestris TaxID=2487750 RepID=A0A8J8P7B9_9EURY|nr:carbohydrate kinase [Halonotius terrestris]TQQ79178.1 carbohydrate kinase [Halonotius terrestris]